MSAANLQFDEPGGECTAPGGMLHRCRWPPGSTPLILPGHAIPHFVSLSIIADGLASGVINDNGGFKVGYRRPGTIFIEDEGLPLLCIEPFGILP